MSGIRVTYSGLISFLICLIRIPIGFAFIIIITRTLTPEEFGIWNLIVGLCVYVMIIHISFRYTEEQSKVIQDDLDFYGDNLIGKTKALKAIPFQILWRCPYGVESNFESPNIRAVEAKRWNTI